MKKKSLKTFFLIYIYLFVIFTSSLFADNASTPYPISLVHKKQEFTPENFILLTEVDEKISIIEFNNLVKTLAVTPGLLQVSIVSPQELSILGKDVGTTFLHIWDAEGLTTLKIAVMYKGYKELRETSAKISKEKEAKPIRIGYEYDVSKSRMKYLNQSVDWKRQDEQHAFSLLAGTPYGDIKGKYAYLFRKSASGKFDDTKFVNFDFKNRFFVLSGGDIAPSFSNITLPRTHVQGIRFMSGKAYKKVKFDFITGTTGYYMWGSRLSRFGQNENRFWGLRTEISPSDDLSLFTTFLKAGKATENTGNVARHLGSLGVKYRIGEYLNFEMESAKNNKNRTAFTSSVKISFDRLYLDATYKDITVDYLNPTGNPPSRGKRGVYTKMKFNPVNIMSFNASFDVYQNRRNPDPDSVERGNKDFSFGTKLTCPPTKTKFLANYYYKDNRAQRFPVVTDGYTCKVTQRLEDIFLLGRITGELQYNTSRYKNFTRGLSNYLDKTLTGSLAVSPLRGLSFSVRETLNFREWVLREYSTAPRRFYAGVSYNSKIGGMPLFINTHLGYQIDSHVNQDKISMILGEDKLIAGAGVRYNIMPSLRAFFDARMERVKGSTNPRLDRIYTRINGGLTMDWDTGFALRKHGTIKGYVFKDINKNEKMDKEDLLVKGAKVSAYEGKSAVTDANGFYRIRYVKAGSRTVTLDITTIPKDYVSTTPTNVRVDIDEMDVTQVDFGVAPKAVVEGLVFNDLNRNKVFDEGIDKPLRNVLIELDDGKTAFTMSHGHFTIRHATLGKRTISIDKNTVPINLIQEPPFTYTVDIREGSMVELQFIFYAPRFVAGKVYMDYNRNKKVDEGEEVSGVELSVGDKSSISDEEGSFVLRDLSSGKIRIDIDKTSLPSNCYVEKEPFELELEKKEDAKRNVNIRLLQKP